MSSAARSSLVNLVPNSGSHAGLLRDCALKHHKEMDPRWKPGDPTPEVDLLKEVVATSASGAYQVAHSRWKNLCAGKNWLTLSAATAGSLAVGLGGASPLEIGLTIHHTYGMPFIPGSAIKGMCRRAAATQGLSVETVACLFGDQARAGAFVFQDAWYDPDTPSDAKGKPFHRDVITVHHQKYYGSRGGVWPTDFDDPTPVPFLVVRPGARFLFAVQCPDGWRDFVTSMLEYGLATLGVGGKTNAGYGRFTIAGGGPLVDVGTPSREVSATPTTVVVPPWRNVTVSRLPGNGSLTATFEGRTATASDALAKRLVESIREELRAPWFSKKRQILADVRVEAVGNAWKIVEITAPPVEIAVPAVATTVPPVESL